MPSPSPRQKALLYASAAAALAGLLFCTSFEVGTTKNAAVRGGGGNGGGASRTLSILGFGEEKNAGGDPRDVQVKEGSDEPTTRSQKNPYASSLDVPLSEVAARASSWLDELPQHLERANAPENKKYGHHRFFPFEPLASCKSTSCVGGDCGADESKIVCGLDGALQDPGCVIYSIGGNNWWDFERDLLEKTKCTIHTFDCTGHLSRFDVPQNDRLKFHHVCLSDKFVPPPAECDMSNVGGRNGYPVCGSMKTIQDIQKSLGHDRIDLLKMDIEGFEWPIFDSWPTLDEPESAVTVLPTQILVEVHYRTFPQFVQLIDGIKDAELWHDFRGTLDLVRLEERLVRMGYAPVVRDDNEMCPHCTELTLIRHTFPSVEAKA